MPPRHVSRGTWKYHNKSQSQQTGIRTKRKYLKLKSSVVPCGINGRRRTVLFLAGINDEPCDNGTGFPPNSSAVPYIIPPHLHADIYPIILPTSYLCKRRHKTLLSQSSTYERCYCYKVLRCCVKHSPQLVMVVQLLTLRRFGNNLIKNQQSALHDKPLRTTEYERVNTGHEVFIQEYQTQLFITGHASTLGTKFSFRNIKPNSLQLDTHRTHSTNYDKSQKRCDVLTAGNIKNVIFCKCDVTAFCERLPSFLKKLLPPN